MQLLRHWLRKMCRGIGRYGNDRSSPAYSRTRLSFDMLEGRTLPDVSITGWTLPPAGTYKIGDVLTFTAQLGGSTTNVVVDTAGGTPSLTIQLNSGNVNALYSGQTSTNVSTLVFIYTVQAGNLDNDGIALVSPIQLNGGTITPTDSSNFDPNFSPPATSNILVDGVPPSIVSVSVPANQTYGIGSNLSFTIQYSEAVTVTGTPRLTLDIGGVTRYANFVSVSGNNLTFTYTVQAGDTDTDGIGLAGSIDLNGGTIRDAANNDAFLNFTTPSTSGILVDGIIPTILNVVSPANGTYQLGDNLDFQFTFSEVVNVNTATGTPRVQLTVGNTTVFATYLSGSGTNTITFRYTVQSGHLDTDGITIHSPIQLAGATIKDAAQNDANLNFTVWPLNGVNVDGVPPTITNVGKPPDGTYPAQKRLDFRIFFSSPVNVAGGTPSILLRVGNQLREAHYLWGSGGNYLVFGYRLQEGESDSDGIEVLGTFLLNGATIKDAAGNDANLSFTAPSTAGVKVDAVRPTIVEIDVPDPGQYNAGDELTLTVRFSKNVNVTFTGDNKPYLRLLIGGRLRKAEYVSGTGTNQLVFRYVVQEEDQDLDGINLLAPLARPRNSAQSNIEDAVGNSLIPDFTPPLTTRIRIRGGSDET